VDVQQAIALIPSDIPYPGAPEEAWSSDPFVVAELLPVPEGGAALAATSVRVASLSPVWEEELVLPRVPAASSVQLRVYDKNLTSGDRLLGLVTIPLPLRPPPCDAEHGVGTSPATDPARFLVQGWFPLTAPPEKLRHLQFALEKLGRAQPLVLGDIYARVSWGGARKAADLNNRPSLRPRIGLLRVVIHGAAGLTSRLHLGGKDAGAPFVRATLENQCGSTPVRLGRHFGPTRR
jgi:hypothetical protein